MGESLPQRKLIVAAQDQTEAREKGHEEALMELHDVAQKEPQTERRIRRKKAPWIHQSLHILSP